jgi:hypothetical protein
MPSRKYVRLPNRRRRSGVTGYKGVVELTSTRWYACVSRRSRKYTLGTFDSPHEAALAVNIGQELLYPGLPAATTKHDLTEEDAVAFTQEVETKVYQLMPDSCQPLEVAYSQLPNPVAVAQAVLEVCREVGKRLTAERLLRSLDSDQEIEFTALDRFVVAVHAARQGILEAVLSATQGLVS